MKNRVFILASLLFLAVGCGSSQECESQKQLQATSISEPKPPIMGWASWNNYRVNINETIVRANADAMASNGMREAGYSYINTDDGFFGGRDELGYMVVNESRFPSGMRHLRDYIHNLGLKAGIYAEAGVNTCGSQWDRDSVSVGNGLFGHEYQDLKMMMRDWAYDFIKVDWCGGLTMGLSEEVQYRKISKLVYEMNPNAVFNICRWQFPGIWALEIADSWRISGDIEASFHSIAHIIDLNADLWRYCSPGKYNDMDMLQVGRGMTKEEDKAHFTMWCMMVSPLLAGNDLTTMSQETLDILTNKEVIALNQDPLFYQARRVVDDGDLEVWAKPLAHTMSGRVAVVLFNRTDKEQDMSFTLSDVAVDAAKGYTLRDLWSKEDFEESVEPIRTFSVPAHGVVTLLAEGTSLPFNVFQK